MHDSASGVQSAPINSTAELAKNTARLADDYEPGASLKFPFSLKMFLLQVLADRGQ